MSEKKISIIPPYVRRNDIEVLEIVTNKIDCVERSGYVSPDKKIQAFIDQGQLMQNYRSSGEEYDIEGGETEAEPDSIEYREELEADAENYDGAVLPQFIDTISACEKLETIEKNFNASELANDEEFKSKKEAKRKQKEFIDDMTSSLAEVVKKNEVKIENENKA